MLKLVVIILLFPLAFVSYAQELNVGLEFTGGPTPGDAYIVAMGPVIEFRPHHSFVSINSGLTFLVYKNESLLTIPLTLKAIIGNKFRFCPTLGGFIRANGNVGYSVGVHLDYQVKENLFIYLKGEYNRDYWKEEVPSHNWGTSEITRHGSSFWIGIGLRVNLF